tara:strand:- start:5528 stop:6370 length:843 start_codon:yes stop_codon:yes gene_type:complete
MNGPALNSNSGTNVTAPPFLKWAGGKRWFAARFLELIPEHYDRYVEPFLGSGAVYFALKPDCALLSDINDDLIDCYIALRDAPSEVEKILNKHHNKHCKKYYYDVRKSKPKNKIQKAAWFIYLNRTCWNGLYRVNKQNQFNVPIGTKTNVILPTDDFTYIGSTLSTATILHQDFEKTIDATGRGDFVFVDPPYTVKHNHNGFLKYNDKIFSWEDQIRLRDSINRAAKRGAKILLTNANHHSVNEIYSGIGEHLVVSRASVLAGSSQHRTRTEELVIRTWA